MTLYRNTRFFIQDPRVKPPLIYSIKDSQADIPSALLDPHYSDRRFWVPQTIFLKKGFELSNEWSAAGIGTVEGASYSYADRLLTGFSCEKTDKAWEAASQSGYSEESAGYREAYLRSLFDNPSIELLHITAEINRSNWYSVLCYGYFEKSQSDR